MLYPLVLQHTQETNSVGIFRQWLEIRYRTLNPGRFGPWSFWPDSFRSGSIRPILGVRRFGLGKWVVSANFSRRVDSALSRSGQSIPRLI